jgi:hypothetical protein
MPRGSRSGGAPAIRPHVHSAKLSGLVDQVVIALLGGAAS